MSVGSISFELPPEGGEIGCEPFKGGATLGTTLCSSAVRFWNWPVRLRLLWLDVIVGFFLFWHFHTFSIRI
jgi:hypothetical protein